MDGDQDDTFDDSISYKNKELFCATHGPEGNFSFFTFGILSKDPYHYSFPLILLQIVLIMITSRAVQFLLRPFHQVRFVGDMIAGFLLGPEFLGRVLPGYRSFVFSERVMMISNTISSVSIMLYAFLISVKMDPMMVVRSGRKALFIALSNTLLPILFLVLAALPFHSHSPLLDTYFFLLSPIAIANFPVIADALTDLNLLNSDLGRLALSSSITNSAVGLFFTIIVMFTNQVRGGLDKAFKMLFSMLAMSSLILFVFRRWMLWIVRRTPKGQNVGEMHVFAVIMCVFAIGLLGEIIGTSSIVGMFVLGLVTPEGPPLGAALVERIELLSNEVMLPLYFVNAASYLRLSAVVDFRSRFVLMSLVWLVYMAKFVWTIVPAIYYCRIPARKAFVLGLIFNLRGIADLLVYVHFRVLSVIDNDSFSIIITSFVLVTAIASPAVARLYKPSAENNPANHATIQHLNPGAQLRLLACIRNEELIPCIINLLEASSAASASAPLFACVLRLDDQPGRSDSTLIAHKNREGFVNQANMDRLHNAFLSYEKGKNGMVEVWPYTSISPFHNISEEICALAAQENVAFVIIPVCMRSQINAGLLDDDHALRSEIPQILAQAPCSVGLLVHKGLEEPWLNSPSKFQQHVGVLFWSGPDYREALAYASRMARHAGVRLTVTRFMTASKEVQDKVHAILDDELMAEFQSENAGNERVMVRQIVVEDMEHALSVIRSVGRDDYDLVVVGLRFGWKSPLLEGLEEWCENPELGVVGDALASFEFDRCFSILIVQQKP